MQSGRQLSSASPDLATSSYDAPVSNLPRTPFGVACDRDTLISALFRETDRAQRMRTPLTLLAFAIQDIATSPLSTAREGVLARIMRKTICGLRSYDVIGLLGDGEFLIALPGCNQPNAIMLAQRLRDEIAAVQMQPPEIEGGLFSFFGIAPSNGRSPLVVLREAQEALNEATRNGPGSICCYKPCSPPESAARLTAEAGDENASR